MFGARDVKAVMTDDNNNDMIRGGGQGSGILMMVLWAVTQRRFGQSRTFRRSTSLPSLALRCKKPTEVGGKLTCYGERDWRGPGKQ